MPQSTKKRQPPCTGLQNKFATCNPSLAFRPRLINGHPLFSQNTIKTYIYLANVGRKIEECRYDAQLQSQQPQGGKTRPINKPCKRCRCKSGAVKISDANSIRLRAPFQTQSFYCVSPPFFRDMLRNIPGLMAPGKRRISSSARSAASN